jgi:CheY-like chemotaxis protein
MLNLINVRVVEVHNGQSALDRLLTQHIDIAVLDIQMPDVSGIEVIRAVAKRYERQIPLIALTADTTDECHRRCVDAGAIAILHKPVTMHSLYRELYQSVESANSAEKKQPVWGLLYTHKRTEIDYALLQELAQSAQHPNYIPRLVACFKKDGEQLLEQLRYALRDENMTKSRALLHRLKGMSGAIGAHPIATLCHENLMSSDTELRVSASVLMKKLFHLHGETMKLLERYLFSMPPATPCNNTSPTPLRHDEFIPSSDRRQCSGSP